MTGFWNRIENPTTNADEKSVLNVAVMKKG